MKVRLSKNPHLWKQKENPTPFSNLKKDRCIWPSPLLPSHLLILNVESKHKCCCPNHLTSGKEIYDPYLNRDFFVSVALVVVSGNHLRFYLHILSAAFWKRQNNACNTRDNTINSTSISCCNGHNYNRMLSFHHLPFFKELIQLWTCRENILTFLLRQIIWH